MALSFATDIRPLFRDEDIECMTPMGIALDAWRCEQFTSHPSPSAAKDGAPELLWPA
jgi:hypothetical protein